MSSILDRTLQLSIFGESHGNALGMVLDRLPAGETINFEELRVFTARRTAKLGDKYATSRVEADTPAFLSGLVNGVTTGTPLAATIENTNTKSEDYKQMQTLARPGHADYTGHIRYNGHNDVRGGGHFSGRLTAPLVLAGGICKQILERRSIFTSAHIYSIKDISDAAFNPVDIPLELVKRLQQSRFALIDTKQEEPMRAVIEHARQQADSVGGIVECAVVGLPAGIGSPIFEGMESVISQVMFSIPAVKGVEFGNGFSASSLFGSENNDAFYYHNGIVKTKTNRHGGILGGISSGMPILARVAFKPTPSIGQVQETVDFQAETNATIAIKGRHDPCIVPRAVVVVESAMNLAILDLCLQHGII